MAYFPLLLAYKRRATTVPNDVKLVCCHTFSGSVVPQLPCRLQSAGTLILGHAISTLREKVVFSQIDLILAPAGKTLAFTTSYSIRCDVLLLILRSRCALWLGTSVVTSLRLCLVPRATQTVVSRILLCTVGYEFRDMLLYGHRLCNVTREIHTVLS